MLDETDSGLDIDALNTVAHGVNTVADGTDMGVLIITHYQRILHMVKPEFVHIMFDGRIVKQAGDLVEQLEKRGYGWIREEVAAAWLRARASEFVSPRAGTSTRRPRHRRRGPCSRRWTATTTSTAPASTAASTRWRRRRPRHTRSRAEGRRLRGLTAGETVFTKNGTEAINLVAYSWGRANLGARRHRGRHPDEHHSNIVPWQLTGGRLRGC